MLNYRLSKSVAVIFAELLSIMCIKPVIGKTKVLSSKRYGSKMHHKTIGHRYENTVNKNDRRRYVKRQH
jgi:hypothetical protein